MPPPKAIRALLFYLALLVLALVPLRAAAAAEELSQSEEAPVRLAYEVNVEGAPTEAIREQLEHISQLFILRERPPATLLGLRRRADNDLPDLLKVLHSQGYFGAQVNVLIDAKEQPIAVNIAVTAGELFTLTNIILKADQQTSANLLDALDRRALGFPYQQPALPAAITAAETKMLGQLAEQGYPFARIIERNALADNITHTLQLEYLIQSGPLAFFGATSIYGLKHVKEELIRKKITWQEGEVFHAQELVKTQQALEALGLFVSVEISYADQVGEQQNLPMKIQLIEGKMRTIGAGISYMNDPGFKVHQAWQRLGVTGAWQHRNIRGIGEKLSLEATLGWKYSAGQLQFVQPEYFRPQEDLIWLAEATHDITKGYTESFLAVSATLERKVSRNLRFSYGLMFKRLLSSHSEKEGRFTLFKIPLQLHWSNADNLLDPVRGNAISYKAIPSYQFLSPRFVYWINTLSYSFYTPLKEDHSLVLALKGTVGTILGAKRRVIPPPERFYAGSDVLLRGYRYKTVSPVNAHFKPLGGLSLAVASAELRWRPAERLGWVLFYDVGNVYRENWPQPLNYKQLQAVGVGLRYPTPIGPVRADLALPLNRRRHIDSAFQLYFSIGQSF